MNSINVCLSCDDNYAMYAGVAIASILSNAAQEDYLSIYVLDGGISEQRKSEILSLKSIKDCSINFVKVDESLFEDYKNIQTHSYISLPAYYRLKMASLLPDISRIIYLDCDVVVNCSLKDLFESNLGDNPFGGVRDINKKMLKKNPNYINSGVLVMDLDNIRKLDLEKTILEWTKLNFASIKVGDQEIINRVCENQITILDDRWNVQSSNFTNRSSYTNEPNVVHFVAPKKPWHWASFSFHRDLYFKYLQLTPWKLSDNEYKHWIKDNQIASLIKYAKYRPIFFLRPRFYVAVYHTYLKDFLEKIFSIKDFGETHFILRILGIKIKFPKIEYAKKKKKSLYYYYKKNNIDITTLPPAEGQLRDIQLANLVLLKELDYVCKQNNINYWLDYGTFLGAVRHKGFIPWDDDIDVGMMREDYENFIKIFNKSTRNTDLYAEYTKDKYNNLIIKIKYKKCKYLFVDIFPFDFFNEKLEIKKYLDKTQEIKKIKKKLLKQKTDLTISELEVCYEKERSLLLNKNNKNASNIVRGIEFNSFAKNWFYSTEDIFPLSTIEFEGYNFSCPNNTNGYLQQLYGNYMTYPKKISMGHVAFLEFDKNDKRTIRDLINKE